MQTQAVKTEASLPKRAPAHPAIQPEHPILNLQQTAGNQAVMRMLRSQGATGAAGSERGAFPAPSMPLRPLALQRKLAINEPGDSYEQEADRVSEQVMRMPASPAASASVSGSAPGVQLKAAGPSGPGVAEAPPIVHEVLRSPGQPLDKSTRTFMEPRFGQDFSAVRVHTDAKAAQSARAVQAKAYTVGRDVVFGSGEFAPGTHEGQRLLGHELTHVVQQGDASPLPLVQRQPKSQPQAKVSKQDEEGKKIAVEKHKKMQMTVDAMLTDARKIATDVSKGPLDPDNLYHNTIELMDLKKILVSFLSPTHDSTTRKPPDVAYFDWHVKYPDPGGDYPADPANTDINTGLRFADADTGGETMALRITVPGFISIFVPDPDLFNKDDLKNVLVHEAQHYADFHGPRMQDPVLIDPAQGGVPLKDWEKVLEAYKSEFRAYWIQPPLPSLACNPSAGCPVRIGFPDLWAPDQTAKDTDEVEVSDPAKCTFCPEPKPAAGKGAKAAQSAPSKVKTGITGKRQQQILHYLMSHYREQQYACCYVYNADFRKVVNKFEVPAGINVANSLRLVNLTIELETMKPTMTRAEVDKTKLVDAVEKLDEIDWAFLQGKLSAPFWELLKNAPVPFTEALSGLAKKAHPSVNDVSDAMAKALAKLK